MSGTLTSRMLAAYNNRAAVTPFFSGMFSAPPENFYDTEEVEIDIEREDEEVAVVVTDLAAGYRMNTDDLYVNKRFKPPVFKEAYALNAFDMLKRLAGRNPHEDVNFQIDATEKSFKLFRKIEKKIRRSIELQGSQIMQTGKVTLTDANGTALYELDFKPKTTHFTTVAVPWDNASNDIKGNLLAQAEVNLNDGLLESDEIDMGAIAWDVAIKDESFQRSLRTDFPYAGEIVPLERRNNGSNFRGVLEIGNYTFKVFTYGGRYIDPETRVKTQLLDPRKVIIRNSTARMDLTFGAVPSFAPVDSRVLKFLPSRISAGSSGRDLFPNAWITPDGGQLMAGIGTRPLPIPTAIDTFSCIDTDIT